MSKDYRFNPLDLQKICDHLGADEILTITYSHEWYTERLIVCSVSDPDDDGVYSINLKSNCPEFKDPKKIPKDSVYHGYLAEFEGDQILCDEKLNNPYGGFIMGWKKWKLIDEG